MIALPLPVPRATAWIVSAFALLPLSEAPAQVSAANTVLRNAGLPDIPKTARDVRTNVWTGASAGVYAAMTMDRETLDAYLAALPGNVTHASPVPFDLQVATPRGLAWFNSARLAGGSVYFRNGVHLSAPERFRVFFLPGPPDEPIPVLIFYVWNFRG